MAVARITVTASLAELDATASKGRFVAVPSVPVIADLSNDVLLAGIASEPFVAGTASLSLPPTDSGVNPTGYTYDLAVYGPGNRLIAQALGVTLPAGSGPWVFADLIDLAPVTDTTTYLSSLTAHLGDTTDAHDASAISYGSYSAADAFDSTHAAPFVRGSTQGLLYDGTDESATLQGILTALAAFGGGELVLEGVVRCDSQITFPTATSGTQVRQPPIRITGGAQYGPGSTWTGDAPYQETAGLDLRYAGRADASCGTTLGSAVITNTAATAADRGNIVTGTGIPDQCWILAVDDGVSWTVSKAARATGTVSLTSFGGRLQGLGYGQIELDHLLFTNNGTASSAPFGLTTGPKVELHSNVFAGHSSKSGATCDEDVWVFGGPGQGTNLTTALTSGQNYTTLAVKALPVGINSGKVLTIGAGATTQQVTTSASAAVGATSISVTSFTANANYGLKTGVLIAAGQLNESTAAWSVPSAPFQGYASHVERNQFYRVRRIVAGLFTTDLYISNNAWMHNCGSNLAKTPSTLTTGLTSGATITSLDVSALSAAVNSGDIMQVGVGDNAQEFTASADAAAGATSISVTSVAADATYAIGTIAFNSSAGIGAMVESYADSEEVNTIHVTHNRMGFSGGYTHATRFAGSTISSVISANNFQDVQADDNFIGAHRFDRDAEYNIIIPGLLGAGVTIHDDWSLSTGELRQTIIAADRASRFAHGLYPKSITVYNPSLSTWTMNDHLGNDLLTLSGAGRQWNYKGAMYVDGNSTGSGSTYFTVGNNSTASDAVLSLNPPTSYNSTIQFKYAGTNRWQIYNGAGANYLYIRDMTGSVMALTFQTGSGITGLATFSGAVVAGSWVRPRQVATGSRPTASSAGAGAMIYDTTLSKPIWSDGTVWRDAAGTAV